MSVNEVYAALLEVAKNTQQRRAEINSQPHFMPISAAAIKISMKSTIKDDSVIDALSKDIIEFISSRYTKPPISSRNGTLYSGSIPITPDNISRFTPAKVYSRSSIIGILHASKDSYESLRKILFTDYLNKNSFKYLKDGEIFNIGYTEIKEEGKMLALTPAGSTAEAVKAKAEELLYRKQALKREVLNAVISNIDAYISDFTLHAEYGAAISSTLSKSFKKGLLSINANIVLIQGTSENLEWGRAVEAELIRKVKKALRVVHFSRNIEEEAAHQVVSTIKGIEITNSSETITTPLINTIKKTVSSIRTKKETKLPQLRIVGGTFVSLTKIMRWINYALQKQIKENMGTGTSRNVLNFRTGRLAESAQVERISQSREGMITAFYSYMKYPYATFSEGGRQELPRSRDPKLLISKSIREIASTIVSNRMRAVNI